MKGLVFAILPVVLAAASVSGCREPEHTSSPEMPRPRRIVDLGALVTDDLPERVWGKGYLRERGYDRPNSFEVMPWPPGPVEGQNSYYTLFNHGGPHVDGPIHMGLPGGVDSFPVESFIGPLRVFDVSHLPLGRTVTKATFQEQGIEPGDVVMIYTAYHPPQADDGYPETIALTREAAEYLASIPIRAFATDAHSVWGEDDAWGDEPSSDPMELFPVHLTFLTRGIPIYEQLFNVSDLLGEDDMYFVGPPLNIKDGDGMIVRPVVLLF